MILISAGLVLAAVILLIAGFVLAKPFLIMWSIVVSVLSALFLVIGALLRRHELFPGGGQAAVPAIPPPAGLVPPGAPHNRTGPMGAQASPPFQRTATLHAPEHSPGLTRGPSSAPASGPHRPVTAKGISPDAIVLVIPGRKRYHIQGCRQLMGRDQEELTYEEAREEGFTPCTACLPDAALGGRQLPSAPDPEPAVATAHQAEPTRDPQSPAVPPKPEPKASTPTSAPSSVPASAEGPTGWFGRPATSSASPPTRPGDGTSSVAGGTGGRPSAASTESEETETKISLPLPDAHRSSEPDRPQQPTTGEEQGKSGGSTGQDASGAGRGAQGERPVGKTDDRTEHSESAAGSGAQGKKPAGKADRGAANAGRTGQRSPQATTAEPDGGSSDPDTRPQPRVTAAGTPVPQSADPSAAPRRPVQGGSAAQTRPESGDATSSPRSPSPGRPPEKGAGAGSSGSDARPSSSGSRPSNSSASRSDGSSGPARPGDGKAKEGSAASGDAGAKSPQGVSDRDRASSGAVPPERPASSAESAKSRVLPTPTGAPDRAAGGRPSTGSGSSPKSSGSERPTGPKPAGERFAGVRSGSESPAGSGPAGERFAGVKPGGDETSTDAAAQGLASAAKDLTEAGEPAPSEGAIGDAKKAGAGMVKVIVGTRRYHGTACPLIQGAGESGVESMTLARAEAAGLTSCSVCQNDPEAVS